jgi:hypothetical protein
MGGRRRHAGWIVAWGLTGCGPVAIQGGGPPANEVVAPPGTLTVAQFARPLRDSWTGMPIRHPRSTGSRFGLPAADSFRLPESAESYRSDLINAIERGYRRSADTIYQVQSLRWSQKYARTVYFTAIGYNPRMEPVWQMYGHYFLPGATANNPGAVIMQNAPLE